MKFQLSFAALTAISNISATLASNDGLLSSIKNAFSIRDEEVESSSKNHLDEAMNKEGKRSPCPEWYDQEGAYKALSAKDKEHCVMEMIKADKGERGEFPDDATFASLMETRDLDLTFGPGDMLPYESKAFHSVGFIASIEYESVGDHPYTGKQLSERKASMMIVS